MKNFLLSLLIVSISFLCTTFILNSLLEKSAKESTSALVTTSEVVEDDDITDVDENYENNDSSELTYESSSDSDYSEILLDYDKWKAYHDENIVLSTDFIPLDDLGDEISKKSFLEKLKTGKYIAVKRYEEDYMYQLYKFDTDTDKKIVKEIKRISNISYSYFLAEGKTFPEFDFKDLNGNEYSSDNTRGKLLVIECWYINCTMCIQEFPKLNKLYDKYEAHEDIVFLSLSFDKSAKLKKFLAKKEFRYPVIADKKDFLQNKVQAKQYPTHLIVDEYGNILKMLNNVNALTLALDNTIGGDLLNDSM